MQKNGSHLKENHTKFGPDPNKIKNIYGLALQIKSLKIFGLENK
jgi:hypothetical protein